jgi:LysM repeat protein
MDTISRENNSLLPIGGVIVGGLALLIAAYSAVSLSKVKSQVAAHEDKLSHFDDVASQASAASAQAASVKSALDQVAKSTQDAFNAVGAEIGTMKADIAKLQETRSAGRAVRGRSHGPAVAGPGEYIIRPGDTLSKIARSNGCSLSDLESVNPGVNSKHLRVGQRIKLPEKASAAPAPAPAPAADDSAVPPAQ